MSNAWRNTAIALGLLCSWQQWRACNRRAPVKETVADCKPTPSTSRNHASSSSGELAPGTFKPMAGVTVARDVLDLVARANQKFTGASHPFDLGDYLVFSTRWEDAISGL